MKKVSVDITSVLSNKKTKKYLIDIRGIIESDKFHTKMLQRKKRHVKIKIYYALSDKVQYIMPIKYIMLYSLL